MTPIQTNTNHARRIIAVGDIHGCYKTFKSLLMDEFKLQKPDTVVCLGDYVDRGHDSKAVVDFIMEMRASGYDIQTLRGNHEQLMIDSTRTHDAMKLWLLKGGEMTLASFGVKSYEEVDEHYKKFFESTVYHLTVNKFVFAHAGLNLEIEDPFEDKIAMLTIRKMRPDKFLDNRILVHGHTPIRLEKILDQKGSKIIDIDGGCVYKEIDGFGNLVGFDITNQRFVTTSNRE